MCRCEFPTGSFQRAYWPRGKVLGGSSSINAMIYMRGSRHDYDKWSKDGAKGWSYKDVLPYFLKSEDNVNADFVKTGKFYDNDSNDCISRAPFHMKHAQ